MEPEQFEHVMSVTRRLDRLRDSLAYEGSTADGYYEPPNPALAACCRVMLTRLMQLRAYDVITEAMDAYTEQEIAVEYAHADQQARWQAAAAERDRRREIAVKVECPHCGVKAGAGCERCTPARTPMGVDVHAARWRAACGLLGDVDAELRAITDP